MSRKGDVEDMRMGASARANGVAGRTLRGRGVRWLLATLLSIAPIVSSAAAPEGVTLQWDAPAECPDRESVETKIASTLGAAPGAAAVSADAKIERVGDAYRLHLVTQSAGGRGERTIDDPSCVALADATALIVALAVDPTLGLAPEPSASEEVASAASSAPPVASAPKPPASASARPRPAPRPSVEPARPEPLRIAIGAGAGVVIGPLPDPTLAVSGGIGVLRGPLRLETAARWLPRSERSIGSRSGAGGRFDLVAGSLGVAYTPLRGEVVEVGPRVALEAGVLHGRAFGVEVPLDGRSLWIAAEAGGTAFFRLGTLAARLDLATIVPFLRPEFIIEGLGPVYRPSSFGGRASLGVEVRF